MILSRPPRPPNRLRKIRQLTSGNRTGDAFGITIPRMIAMRFSNVMFSIRISGNSIILQSGGKINV